MSRRPLCFTGRDTRELATDRPTGRLAASEENSISENKKRQGEQLYISKYCVIQLEWLIYIFLLAVLFRSLSLSFPGFFLAHFIVKEQNKYSHTARVQTHTRTRRMCCNTIFNGMEFHVPSARKTREYVYRTNTLEKNKLSSNGYVYNMLEFVRNEIAELKLSAHAAWRRVRKRRVTKSKRKEKEERRELAHSTTI